MEHLAQKHFQDPLVGSCYGSNIVHRQKQVREENER